MKLIGRYSSPFVRRVAVTLQHYKMAYEHQSVMPFGDGRADVGRLNPIARVPILQLDANDVQGEMLFDSAAILDHLDEAAGPDRALVPRSGKSRRDVLARLAIALGSNEKLVTALYERHFRPKEIWYQPWIDACEQQVRDGYLWLEDQFIGPWFMGETMTQADLTTAVFWTFGMTKRPGIFAKLNCPKLRALGERLEATPAFQAVPLETEMLSSQLGD
ncbi:MAG: glutathione S-transferase family protein [Alphaproteobacteria bacterium]|jgi:glutathione S-transferase|nr:glutathione S-transferase family protein [Alphaproteobacteria bacterium]